MSLCNYVRKVNGQYEYGYMKVADEKKGVYKHEPTGTAATYEEALSSNEMALHAQPRSGMRVESVWRDLP